MVKILGAVMMLGVYGIVSGSSFQYARWYSSLVSQSEEQCTSILSAQKKPGFEREESKTIEKQPNFEIETTELNYVRTTASYPQITAAKQAPHKSALKTIIQFWRS